MITLVNLLAWRERRLRVRLRFWLIVMGGTVSIALFMTTSRSVGVWQEGQRQRLLLNNERNTLHNAQRLAVSVNQQKLQLTRQQDAARQAQRRLAQSQRWSRALSTLAQVLPAQTWLSAVEMRENAMQVDGLSRDEAGILALKTRASTAELRLIGHGALQRQNNGEWRFSLTFDTGGERAATP